MYVFWKMKTHTIKTYSLLTHKTHTMKNDDDTIGDYVPQWGCYHDFSDNFCERNTLITLAHKLAPKVNT